MFFKNWLNRLVVKIFRQSPSTSRDLIGSNATSRIIHDRFDRSESYNSNIIYDKPLTPSDERHHTMMDIDERCQEAREMEIIEWERERDN